MVTTGMRPLAYALLFVLVVAQGLNAEDAKAAATQPKKSSIIPSAGEVELTNGIGDVKPNGECLPGQLILACTVRMLTAPGHAGPCQADIKNFCKDVSPGDGRVVTCLIKRILQAKQGNIAGGWRLHTSKTLAHGMYSSDPASSGRVVGDKCVEDVNKFKIDRSKHINRDLALGRCFCSVGLPGCQRSQLNISVCTTARACKDDVAKICKDTNDNKVPGATLVCLRYGPNPNVCLVQP